MMIESMTIQLLHVILSATTQSERLGTTRHLFGASSAAEGWLTAFAIAALITAVILFIWLSIMNKRTMEQLQEDIAESGLTAAINELRQNIAKLGLQSPVESAEQIPSQEPEEFAAVLES